MKYESMPGDVATVMANEVDIASTGTGYERERLF